MSEFTTSADKPSGYLYEYLSELLQEPPYYLPHLGFADVIKESGGHGEQVKVRRELDLDVADLTGAGLPFLSEDQDPTPHKMTKQDMLVTMYEMGAHIRLTKKLKYDSYDDEQSRASRALNVHMYRSMDIFARETLNGGTNVFRALNDVGGSASTRATVLGVPSKKALQKIRLGIRLNRMREWTNPVLGTGRIGTTPVRPGYPTIVTARLLDIIEDVLGSEYKSFVESPSGEKIHPAHRGSWKEFHFILADQGKEWRNAGGAVGSTGLYSTGGSNVDVHSMVILGEHAYGARMPLKVTDTKRIAGAKLITNGEGSSGVADAFKRFSSVGWYMRQGMRIWEQKALYRGEFAVPA